MRFSVHGSVIWVMHFLFLQKGENSMDNIGIDNVSENLGLYDFFNVIGTGSIFIIHLFMIFPKLLTWYYIKISHQIVAGIGLIVLAFLVGLIIQEIATFIDDKWLKIKHRRERRFLILEDIIGNKIKFEQYKNCLL